MKFIAIQPDSSGCREEEAVSKAITTTIPFSGFYNSLWSDELDQQETFFVENYEEDQKADGIPAPFRLPDEEVCEILWRVTDYREGYVAIAKRYVEAFSELASERLGFDLGLTFDYLDQPREYNFQTDRIFCFIPPETVQRLFALSEANNHIALSALILERFTGCSGFIPFYPNDLGSWLDKPLSEWDHNEVGTLLEATVGQFNELEDLYYRVADSDALYPAWEVSVDWDAFRHHVEEAREKKRDQWAKDNPEAVIPYRCPQTPDLFAPL